MEAICIRSKTCDRQRLQQAAEENAGKISFEAIPCSCFLLKKFKQFKGRVKSAENLLLFDLLKRKTY